MRDHRPVAEAAPVPEERLDRQLRIPGWNQEALSRARVGVCGDDPWLTGLVVAGAAALGLGELTVVAPALDPRLAAAARGLHPGLRLSFFPGYFSHPLLEDLWRGCEVLVDVSHYGLAGKLLLNLAHRQGIPLVRGGELAPPGRRGFKVFTYQPGREWRELLELPGSRQLPGPRRGDPVLALMVAGLVLEEVKKVLLGEPVTPAVVRYEGGRAPGASLAPLRPLMAGAGALGNFVGLGLAAAGCPELVCLDPDVVEITNLNRQILFWDKVGEPKARALARRLKEWFGINTHGHEAYAGPDTDFSGCDVVFECTDNFESRIILSETCRDLGLRFISGGAGVAAGQVVGYDPREGGPTPAALLGLYEIVAGRDVPSAPRDRASCVYQPDPAVIMTNLVVAGLMLEACRRLLAGEENSPLFYDARAEEMLSGFSQ
uniref:THIF-type NAD/FAD binding fold domain-containing protein n=1 Tax=Desulfobacca acetoxidans TaxID=60893 RepID=A0A7V4LCG9_9BACT